MFKLNGKNLEVKDSIWAVLELSGYKVAESDNFCEEAKKRNGKYYMFDSDGVTIINSGKITPIAKAESIAIGLETAMGLDIEYYYAEVCDDEVMEICDFFGFEDYLEKGTQKDKFFIKKDDFTFIKGHINKDFIEMRIEYKDVLEAARMSGNDMESTDRNGILLYADENGEGTAYEIALNLRINGCIGELYTDGGSINQAEEYANKHGIGCVMRCFADGRMIIKDLEEDTIFETNIVEFLEDPEEEDECDCGCGHHHHHHDEEYRQ